MARVAKEVDMADAKAPNPRRPRLRSGLILTHPLHKRVDSPVTMRRGGFESRRIVARRIMVSE